MEIKLKAVDDLGSCEETIFYMKFNGFLNKFFESDFNFHVEHEKDICFIVFRDN